MIEVLGCIILTFCVFAMLLLLAIDYSSWKYKIGDVTVWRKNGLIIRVIVVDRKNYLWKKFYIVKQLPYNNTFIVRKFYLERCAI